ncbi:uncharacterized protein DUF4240 [Asanoa ferruginea]|uniref:Uncharacterized protein DUF4240 n=1 Tax=Asanoa ferruginea TaxID=53367 RepID=A0A3D9ZDW4_9ACTN|nr:DUF4240 domain-containing protein [Asanoa ferruginea]REF95608.1 uncharacterized protein DUF4240 [Asanoa ferruginea]GIF51970.1 hypothetical protein Afe04nite_65090 [Asanoa ferruginea]
MNEEGFWQIVDECRLAAGPDTERVAQLILRRLRALSEQEILDYEELWFRAQDEAFTWPIRNAASLLFGGVDDEDFMLVQDWIVSHGRAVLERVKTDPDRLVELMADRHNARIDWFCGLPVEAHIARLGCPPAMDDRPGPAELAGAAIDLTDEREVRRCFPRIAGYLDANRWITRPWSDD